MGRAGQIIANAGAVVGAVAAVIAAVYLPGLPLLARLILWGCAVALVLAVIGAPMLVKRQMKGLKALRKMGYALRDTALALSGPHSTDQAALRAQDQAVEMTRCAVPGWKKATLDEIEARHSFDERAIFLAAGGEGPWTHRLYGNADVVLRLVQDIERHLTALNKIIERRS